MNGQKTGWTTPEKRATRAIRGTMESELQNVQPLIFSMDLWAYSWSGTVSLFVVMPTKIQFEELTTLIRNLSIKNLILRVAVSVLLFGVNLKTKET